ncbi:hypothetical protein [Streptomyces sp. NPDC001020]
MRITLFGATEMAGSRIAAAARQRGHQVTAVSRSDRSPVAGVTTTAANASDPAKMDALATGTDAATSTSAPPRDGTDPKEPFRSSSEAYAVAFVDELEQSARPSARTSVPY